MWFFSIIPTTPTVQEHKTHGDVQGRSFPERRGVQCIVGYHNKSVLWNATGWRECDPQGAILRSNGAWRHVGGPVALRGEIRWNFNNPQGEIGSSERRTLRCKNTTIRAMCCFTEDRTTITELSLYLQDVIFRALQQDWLTFRTVLIPSGAWTAHSMNGNGSCWKIIQSLVPHQTETELLRICWAAAEVCMHKKKLWIFISTNL